MRKLLIACSIALGTLTAGTVHAVELTSAELTIDEALKDSGNPFVFDFTGDPDMASVDGNSTLTNIAVEWTFETEDGSSLDLVAGLTVAGEDVGIGMDAAINGAGSVNAGSANFSSSGLPFSGPVIGELLADTSGELRTGLALADAGTQDFVDFNAFFANGGTATGVLTLITLEDGNPGGGGNPVPEPASLLIWGMVGAGALARRQMKRQKTA